MFDFAQTRVIRTEPFLFDFGVGLVVGTMVATHLGWRPVEAVVAGDQCLTFDGGLQVVTAVSRRTVKTKGAAADPLTWPLVVPVGALGNREELMLLPEQAVLIESDTAEQVFGDPFALIPAAALDGLRGVYRKPPAAEIEVVTLHFSQDEIVYANVGALFYCPVQTDLLAEPTVPAYEALSMDDAELLVHFLKQEDAGQVAYGQATRAFRLAA
ncbi:Hint domain-containing protein [Loktanella sp. TSTF-M6]|uniref:Hint domain-containing protein n=1 Tax=Loktanella gaetbuli TaxID=2881335 RepID=A0ABS8BSD2_9RHOB|nr:Hint domain-containing protein [Loktanella gaetbuli]MCB5198648.1 Hint domain-containing protein [Loktanella gaetbuli]